MEPIFWMLFFTLLGAKTVVVWYILWIITEDLDIEHQERLEDECN